MSKTEDFVDFPACWGRNFQGMKDLKQASREVLTINLHFQNQKQPMECKKITVLTTRRAWASKLRKNMAKEMNAHRRLDLSFNRFRLDKLMWLCLLHEKIVTIAARFFSFLWHEKKKSQMTDAPLKKIDPQIYSI